MNMKTGSPLFNKGRGFILLSVMFTVTLLITSATAFAWFARNEMQRARSEIFMLQARSVAEIACRAAGERIAKDKNGYDSYTEPLYLKVGFLKFIFGDFEAKVRISPMDDKISFAAILLPDGVTVRKEYEYAWERIWENLKHDELNAVVIDFIDNDTHQRIGGRESSYNINRTPAGLSELKLLPEIDDGILYGTKKVPIGFSHYINIYGGDKININTARPEVVAILDSRLGKAAADGLLAARAARPIKSNEELANISGFSKTVVTKLTNIIGFESQYFRVDIDVQNNISGEERKYKAILKRGGNACKLICWKE